MRRLEPAGQLINRLCCYVWFGWIAGTWFAMSYTLGAFKIERIG